MHDLVSIIGDKNGQNGKKDLRINIGQENWWGVLADCRKYVREARGGLHRHYHTLRLHRIKVMKDNMCWKCKLEL